VLQYATVTHMYFTSTLEVSEQSEIFNGTSAQLSYTVSFT